MTLSVLLVDDEPLALDLLEAFLTRMPGVVVAGRADGGQAAVERIAAGGIDLVLLDVQMPEVNGFDVIRQVPSDLLPMVVFVSAHADYAIDAFEVHAADYVLKPVGETRLRAAVERAQRLAAADPPRSANKAGLLAAARSAAGRVAKDMTVPPPEGDVVVLRERGRALFLPKAQIVWVEAAGDYVLFHERGDVHEFRGTMREAADMLGPGFWRVHRSAIVNWAEVREVKAAAKGDATLCLADGRTLRVSRRYRRALPDV